MYNDFFENEYSVSVIDLIKLIRFAVAQINFLQPTHTGDATY